MSGLQFGESPLDLSPNPLRDKSGLFWASQIFLYVSLILSVLNAGAIRDWSNQLRVNQITEPVINAIQLWHQELEKLHLTVPMSTARSLWLHVKADYLDRKLISINADLKNEEADK